MTCKYLSIKVVPIFETGSLTPTEQTTTVCSLNRPPYDEFGWANKCHETPKDGPCWVWLANKGNNVPDPSFK